MLENTTIFILPVTLPLLWWKKTSWSHPLLVKRHQDHAGVGICIKPYFLEHCSPNNMPPSNHFPSQWIAGNLTVACFTRF
ncbi:hypothetical protein XELAEV_18031773mg [Xenopus laevis]|uniref:Uncharacterized protein n=1 Tax=Xenopus laevis TaxID=8355 RepID=A0A974CN69_XENLA|nr:hypothetical protein XELAEV_18031773mg [Xenopus laevis]